MNDYIHSHFSTLIHLSFAPRSVRHALTAQRLGADFISIDGLECAGHPGEFDVGNWILLAQCKQKLKIPYIVSGGCANGSQLAAALTLGAQGMNMGTRFMATKEGMLILFDLVFFEPSNRLYIDYIHSFSI